MAGLVKCPGYPVGYPCGSWVRQGRICGTCHDVKHNHPNDDEAARDAHQKIQAANDWVRR